MGNIFSYLADKLYLSSSSSTLNFDDPEIPALKELKVEMRKHMVNCFYSSLDTYRALMLNMGMDISAANLSKAFMPVDLSEPKDGTLENLLIWGRNRKNNVSYFLNSLLMLSCRYMAFIY